MYSLDYEKGINNYSLESEMKKIIRVLLKISIVNDKILNNQKKQNVGNCKQYPPKYKQGLTF